MGRASGCRVSDPTPNLRPRSATERGSVRESVHTDGDAEICIGSSLYTPLGCNSVRCFRSIRPEAASARNRSAALGADRLQALGRVLADPVAPALLAALVSPLMEDRFRVDGRGNCHQCGAEFPYMLIHNGFNESAYAYCGGCGRLGLLSLWTFREACLAPEHGPIEESCIPDLAACVCGGRFSARAAPRCPGCGNELDPELVAGTIEAQAPGARNGWRWSRTWSGIEALAVSHPPVDLAWSPPTVARRIRVELVFLVPRDASPPESEHPWIALRHLRWARARFFELLEGRDTFWISAASPILLPGRKVVSEYRASQDGGAEDAVLELFARGDVDRMTCASLYVVFFCGTGWWPQPGGRPINGGINAGGGVVVLAERQLFVPNFQATLQHELGHAIGLVHVDAYGHDGKTSPSLMSYNLAHGTNVFEPSATPGALIAEDRRALNHATRVFPRIAREPLAVGAADRVLAPIVLLEPMQLAGQPDYVGPSIVE